MARGAFWTIIVDDQPTAFRAPVREDLLPTLKQLHRQHPSAVIKWFQRGRLWDTPGDAMDASKPPRRGPGWRPGGAHKDPREQYKVPRDVKRARWASQAAEGRGPWVKGDKPFNAERRPVRRSAQGEGRSPNAEGRPAWKPKGDRPANAEGRPSWKPKGDRPANAERRPVRRSAKGDGGTSNADGRPQGKPKGDWRANAERWASRGDEAKGGRPTGASKPGGAGNASGNPRGPRPDWRGDRPARDATPRSAAQPPSPVKKARTWRVGELPPADRKRKKGDD